MKKILVILLLVFLVSSCGNLERTGWFCNCKENENVRKFMDNNIGKANNMSDEEMEDVIRQLHYSAIKINCHQKRVIIERESHTLVHKNLTLDSCEVYTGYYE